jgi:hypothetical protein
MSSAPSASTSPEIAVRITRFPSITEPQFFGCLAAFVDSLFGELNASAIALRRLEGRGKGSAFAYEMTLDQHRYGALIVIDRWSTVVRAFGPHLELSRHPAILTETASRVSTAETILGRANQLIDASGSYATAALEACLMAFRSLETTFEEERAAAAQYATLGPMLPEDYLESRRIFLEDLAAR